MWIAMLWRGLGRWGFCEGAVAGGEEGEMIWVWGEGEGKRRVRLERSDGVGFGGVRVDEVWLLETDRHTGLSVRCKM